MTVVTRRRSNPFAEMMSWLEDPHRGPRGWGPVPATRTQQIPGHRAGE